MSAGWPSGNGCAPRGPRCWGRAPRRRGSLSRMSLLLKRPGLARGRDCGGVGRAVDDSLRAPVSGEADAVRQPRRWLARPRATCEGADEGEGRMSRLLSPRRVQFSRGVARASRGAGRAGHELLRRRDLELLGWLAEQYGARIDQLGVLLGAGPRTCSAPSRAYTQRVSSGPNVLVGEPAWVLPTGAGMAAAGSRVRRLAPPARVALPCRSRQRRTPPHPALRPRDGMDP